MASSERTEVPPSTLIPHTIHPTVKIESYEFHQDGGSEYRIRVGQQTKYISLAAGAIPSKNLINFSCSPLIGGAALAPLPPGDWNHGVITKCPLTNKPVWTTMLDDWPGVTALWHDVTIDATELTTIMFIRRNVEIVTCPRYADLNLVFKFAPFPCRIPAINHETQIYKTIIGEKAELDGEHMRPGPW